MHEIHLAELSSNLSLLTLMYTCILEHSDGYFIPSMLSKVQLTQLVSLCSFILYHPAQEASSRGISADWVEMQFLQF